MLGRIDAKFPEPEERAYMANVAFVRSSVNWQGWLGKMAQLLPMASTLKDERAP